MRGTWFHFSMKALSRSAGRSAVAAAAYRLGASLHDEEVDRTHDYRRRSGVAVSFTCAPADAPEWAHEPERLWNAASAAEKRKNSTLAREVELALPAAVPPEARENIARAVAQELVSRYGVAVSGAIHAPSREGDQRNFHAHILFTTRRMEGEGLTTKTRILDDRKTGPEEVTYLRGFACDLINAALADAGSDERVDHRSFAARGIEDEPTTHLGPAATGIERREEKSERHRANYEIVAGNDHYHELAEALAALEAEIAAEEQQAAFAVQEPQAVEAAPTAPPSPGEGLAGADKGQAEPVISAAPIDPLPPFELLDQVHAEALARIAQEEPADAQPSDAAASMPDPASELAAVHNERIAQAEADYAVVQQEEASGGRFDRIRAWWGNLRDHFTEWRSHLSEQVGAWRDRWSSSPLEPDPPAPDVTPPPGPEL